MVSCRAIGRGAPGVECSAHTARWLFVAAVLVATKIEYDAAPSIRQVADCLEVAPWKLRTVEACFLRALDFAVWVKQEEEDKYSASLEHLYNFYEHVSTLFHSSWLARARAHARTHVYGIISPHTDP